MADCGQLAQTPLSCQFCESNTEVKWKCYDCCLLLCSPCKFKVHSKLSFHKEHNIVDIRNISDKDVNSFSKEDWHLHVVCESHAPNTVCLFCKTCDKLICSLCLLEGHKTHELNELQVALDSKKTFLKKVVENIDQKLLMEIQKEQQTFDELWSNQQRHECTIKDNIQTKTEELVLKINERCTHMLDQHRLFYQKVNTAFGSVKKTLDQQEQQYLDHRNKIDTILSLENPIEILNLSKESVEPSKFTKPSLDFSNSVLCFAETELTAPQISTSFGKLLQVSNIKSFNTHLPDINVLNSKGDYIWINNKEKRTLKKLIIESGFEEDMKFDDLEATDFSITPNDELILKISKANKVKMLTTNGKLKLYKDFSPLKPTAVHVTATGDVLIGTKEMGPNFTVPNTGKRQVQVFSIVGKQKEVFEFDEKRQRLFTYVWCLNTTNEGDIIVIDRLSDEFNGRVMMISKEGKLQWQFKGNTNKEPFVGQFKPRCVTVKNGVVITSERLSHSLHLLDTKSGQFLTTIDTSQLHIYLPQSLSLDPSGNLWIGCGSYRGARDDAKIHLISLSFLE